MLSDKEMLKITKGLLEIAENNTETHNWSKYRK